ncbi:DinB family protein [bacterium]|nr:DinB family protein [bacterium]
MGCSEKELLIQGWNFDSRLTERIIAAFSDKDLDFKATPEMMSLRGLVEHIVVSQNFLICGIKGSWDFANFEMQTSMQTVSDAVKTYKEVNKKLIASIEEATEERLAETHDVWKMGKEFSVATVCTQLREHEIHHRGQLYVYARLCGIVPPDLYGG